MKALIINSPSLQRVNQDENRFDKLVKALSYGGIHAKYYPVYTVQCVLNALTEESWDIVFCASDYVSNGSAEKINIHSFLEKSHVPYIGSSSDTLDLVRSKSTLKRLWLDNNVNTPDFFVVNKSDFLNNPFHLFEKIMDFPYILKPDTEGNSRGINEHSVVFDINQLALQLEALFLICNSVLIEKYLAGTSGFSEFTVAMIGNNNRRFILPVQIVLKNKHKVRVITTADKDNHNTQAIPLTDDLLHQKVIDFATRAFDSAGVQDYARCDLIYTENQLWAIEINGQPMVPDKWFESCAAGANLNSEQYLNAIFLAGLQRNINEGNLRLDIPSQMRFFLPETVYTLLS